MGRWPRWRRSCRPAGHPGRCPEPRRGTTRVSACEASRRLSSRPCTRRNRQRRLRQALGARRAGRGCPRLLGVAEPTRIGPVARRAPSNAAAGSRSPSHQESRNEFLSAQVRYAPPGNPKQVSGQGRSDTSAPRAPPSPPRLPDAARGVRAASAGTWYPDPLMEDQPFNALRPRARRHLGDGPRARGRQARHRTGQPPACAADGRTGDVTRSTQRAGVGHVSFPRRPTSTPASGSPEHNSTATRHPGRHPHGGLLSVDDLATSHRLSPIDFVQGPTAPMVKVFRDADGKLSYGSSIGTSTSTG